MGHGRAQHRIQPEDSTGELEEEMEQIGTDAGDISRDTVALYEHAGCNYKEVFRWEGGRKITLRE